MSLSRPPEAAGLPPAIRVLLVDDHRVLRDGLRAMFSAQPDIDVVGEAADGPAAIAQVDALQPDVVVLDVALPGMTGLQVLQSLQARASPPKVLMLSMQDEPGTVASALRLGALGYMSKAAAGDELIVALRAVAAGRRYLPPAITAATLDALLTARRHADASDERQAMLSLSARERQVMQMLCQGQSTAQIAAALALSPKTVDTYRARLMAKLEVTDLPALVRLALRTGLIRDA